MPYDPAVIRAINRIGRRRHEPRKYVLGELATGIVESGLQNLPGGDADSYGFRQQRASIYGRQPLRKQINNLFDEFHQYDRGQSLGNLIADVQRPAEQYRGRYAQVLDDARKLMRGDYTGGTGTIPTGTEQMVQPGQAPAPAPNIFSTLSSLTAPQAQQDPMYAQLQRGWDLLAKLQSQKEGQAAPDPTSFSGATSTGHVSGGKGSSLAELFYDPGINIDNGAKTKAIGGHGDHVHAAFSNPQDRALALKLAGQLGLTVTSEGGGQHVAGSYHYRKFKNGQSEAVDFGGSPQAMLAFDKLLAKRFR